MPRNAETDAESGLRTYQWRGRRLLSVTSLRRVIGMPFPLHAWTVAQTIDASIALSQIAGTLADDDLTRQTIRKGGVALRDVAASLGTRVHEAAEQRLDPRRVEPDIAGHLTQYYAAIDTLRLDVLVAEAQVFNLSMGYAGSLDMIASVIPDGREQWLACVDIKTGRNLYVDHVLQQLGYIYGEFIGRDDVVDEEATRLLRNVQGVGILHLSPSEWEWVEIQHTDEDANAFADMVRLANWMAAHPDIEPFVKYRRDKS